MHWLDEILYTQPRCDPDIYLINRHSQLDGECNLNQGLFHSSLTVTCQLIVHCGEWWLGYTQSCDAIKNIVPTSGYNMDWLEQRSAHHEPDNEDDQQIGNAEPAGNKPWPHHLDEGTAAGGNPRHPIVVCEQDGNCN